MRRGSSTHSRWAGVELSARTSGRSTSPQVAPRVDGPDDGATLFYLVSQAYSPSHERGARWDDPAFGIDWPDPGVPVVLSPKDASWPDYTEDQAVAGLL